jgi:acetyl-CoA C-acetyltransferase
MSMIETAEIVADRYGVSREDQDEYSAESQKRTAAFQESGQMAEEIVPLKTRMKLVNKETGEETFQDVVCDRDECNRPGTTGIPRWPEACLLGRHGRQGRQVCHRR